ncbi:MAG: discoidin domain-containing protein [Salinivirgaceae bacterium]
MNKLFIKISTIATLIIQTTIISAQTKTLDDFENKTGWNFIKSDGVSLNLTNEKGLTGNAIRFDYDFTKGTGYGGIQKLFPIDLPENYEFTFYVKAESPANNFEIKFIDKTGDNVWWVSNRNYDFPTEWKKVTIKKRHINFAWGPTTDQNLKRIDRIEFTIASFIGGKGTVWLDNFKFEPLPAETSTYPQPTITATSSAKNHSTDFITDGSSETYWQSTEATNQHLVIDFKTRREFGGLQINWLENNSAKSFDILLSADSKTWEKAYTVQSNQSNISFIRLPEAEAHYVRIDVIENSGSNVVGIREIKFLSTKESLTQNDFLIYTASNSPKGNYPRYFSKQASFWTITGVNNDTKEALINEDGMVEVDKGLFSIEPLIKIGDSLFNWSNVASIHSMGELGVKKEFDFVPTVTWQLNQLTLETGVTAIGEANKNSKLNIRYKLKNRSNVANDFEFYLLIRPYQVNPYYQFLNYPGGVGKIKSITEGDGNYLVVDDKTVLFQKSTTHLGPSIPMKEIRWNLSAKKKCLWPTQLPIKMAWQPVLLSIGCTLMQARALYCMLLSPFMATNRVTKNRVQKMLPLNLPNHRNSGKQKQAISNSIYLHRPTVLLTPINRTWHTYWLTATKWAFNPVPARMNEAGYATAH